MNILFVTSNFPPMDGGIAVFDYHICKELFARGHKVVVVANQFQGCEDFDSKQDFSIVRLNGKIRPTSVEYLYNVLYLTIKEKIEVIFFGHFGSTHWLGGVLVKNILKLPYLILVHGTEFNAYFHTFTMYDRLASKIVLSNAKIILVNSFSTKRLVESHGYPSEHIKIIHPGTDPESFHPLIDSALLREKYCLNGKKIVMIASRLVKKKNHINLLNAFHNVVKKIPNSVLLIVGQGEEKESIIAKINELHLNNYVKFVGYVDPSKMSKYYAVCDVYVMPSKTVGHDYESFGIVYVEANACGKPVIAGKSGGIEDAVIDGVTGLLVDPENVEEIAQAIIRLLTDQEYARQLGENGRRRVEKELNWRMVGKKIEEILKTVKK